MAAGHGVGPAVRSPQASCKGDQECPDKGFEPKAGCHHERSVGERPEGDGQRMKPRRPTSFPREVASVEPSSTSVCRPEGKPETQQRPMSRPDPEPARPGSAMLQEPGTPQKQDLPSEPTAQHEAESQQEPRGQQRAALQTRLAPVASAAQESPPQKAHLPQQEATSHQPPGARKWSETQQEALREEQEGMPGPGPGQPPLDPQQVDTSAFLAASGTNPELHTQPASVSQERLDPAAAQQTPLDQRAKSNHVSVAESGFLTRLHELSIPRSTHEWRTFFDWVTDSDTEAHLSSSSSSVPPKPSCATVIPGLSLPFKRKSDCEKMSGYGGKSHGKKATLQNHKHYWGTGECERGPPAFQGQSCSHADFVSGVRTRRSPPNDPVKSSATPPVRRERPCSLETANAGLETGFLPLHQAAPPP